MGACASTRPQGRSCAFSQIAYPIGIGTDSLDHQTSANFQRLLTASLKDREAGLPTAQDPWQWLVLSGGGQWGAFGAGFLKGWSDHGDRPVFDVVTGVSTGALIAPYAFLGKNYDDTLMRGFLIISEKEVVRRRTWFALLGNNSLYDTHALSIRVLHNIAQYQMIKLLAAEKAVGRRLLIGVVNADDGVFYAIDLTDLADQKSLPVKVREQCMADYMLASAGVPIAFSPTFIEGQMLMDGSARTSVFIGDLSTVASRYGTRAINIYVIKNGNLKIRPAIVKNRLASIALRSAEIILDQIGSDSLRTIVQQPRLKGQTRIVTADIAECDATNPAVQAALFVPQFMSCLVNEGRRIGQSGENRWLKNLTSGTK